MSPERAELRRLVGRLAPTDGPSVAEQLTARPDAAAVPRPGQQRSVDADEAVLPPARSTTGRRIDGLSPELDALLIPSADRIAALARLAEECADGRIEPDQARERLRRWAAERPGSGPR